MAITDISRFMQQFQTQDPRMDQANALMGMQPQMGITPIQPLNLEGIGGPNATARAREMFSLDAPEAPQVPEIGSEGPLNSFTQAPPVEEGGGQEGRSGMGRAVMEAIGSGVAAYGAAKMGDPDGGAKWQEQRAKSEARRDKAFVLDVIKGRARYKRNIAKGMSPQEAGALESSWMMDKRIKPLIADKRNPSDSIDISMGLLSDPEGVGQEIDDAIPLLASIYDVKLPASYGKDTRTNKEKEYQAMYPDQRVGSDKYLKGFRAFADPKKDAKTPVIKTFRTSDGELQSIDVSTPAGAKDARELISGGAVMTSATSTAGKPTFVNFETVDGERVTVDTSSESGQAEAAALIAAGGNKVSGKDKATVDENKNVGFYTRIAEANAQFDALAEASADFTGSFDIGGSLPNRMQTEQRQLFEQGKKNFINSVLRRESGAVISEAEFVNADMQYFPQPGDSPTVVKQKKKNRKTVEKNMRAASGSALQGRLKLDKPNDGKTNRIRFDAQGNIVQ